VSARLGNPGRRHRLALRVQSDTQLHSPATGGPALWRLSPKGSILCAGVATAIPHTDMDCALRQVLCVRRPRA